MDGGNALLVTTTLGDMIERGMRNQIPFQTLRRHVYTWMRQQGNFLIATERVGEGTSYIIMVTYWNQQSELVVESFDEWSSYTKRHPVSTW
jgi:hypothetical protein